MSRNNIVLIQVREYAKLTLVNCKNTLDLATISNRTFEWLVGLIEEKRLNARIGRNYIKLGSQVGYIEVPNGESIEILPKIATAESLSEATLVPLRLLLKKMVMKSYRLEGKSVGSASLKSNRMVIHEWIFSNFLMELQKLLRKGLRGDYQSIKATEKFLKGRLNLNEVMRQRPGKAHYFPQDYDEFNYARIENRLIKSALELIVLQTKSNHNWKLANEFVKRFGSIPSLKNINKHFSEWEQNKLMLKYNPILPWCRLILEKINPNFQKGRHQGITFLFPMEQLFEQYVGKFLQQHWRSFKVVLQKRPLSLLQHRTREGQEFRLFNIQPDITIIGKDFTVIGDTKWKILNEDKANGSVKYGISQSDIYQVLGYGYRYQHEGEKCQNLLLIYPYSPRLTEMLPPFKNYGKDGQLLNIWVIPFAFGIENNGQLPEGLVIGNNDCYFVDDADFAKLFL